MIQNYKPKINCWLSSLLLQERHSTTDNERKKSKNRISNTIHNSTVPRHPYYLYEIMINKNIVNKLLEKNYYHEILKLFKN